MPFIIFTAIWGSTWIVIRGQLGVGAAAMVGDLPLRRSPRSRWPASRRGKARSLNLGRKGLLAAAFLGFSQFCVNFNAVYLAERHITSGVVATVFALLLIPATLLGWLWLGHRPSKRFAWSSLVAVTGIVLLFVHELREHPADSRADRSPASALTLVGMFGAAIANVAAGAAGDPPLPAVRAARLVDGGGRGHRRHHRLRHDRTAGVRPATELLARRALPRACSPRS